MNMKFQFPLIVCAAITAASAETVDLKGTVSNRSGKPVPGAIVTIPGKKLSDTTDSQGAYSFAATAARSASAPSHVSGRIEFNGGAVSLGIPRRERVTIEAFDLRGNLLVRLLSRTVETGEYRFDLGRHPLSAKMMVLRVSVGSRIVSFRHLALNGSRAISAAAGISAGIPGTLAKTRDVVDTMKVSASGYVDTSFSISSYQGTLDIALDSIALEKFSFFVTSLKALQELSGSENGFGGDFRFGKTGQGAGLLGADSICQCIAERSMPGSKVKQWRAFLSVAKGPDGKPVNAADRIGDGPWYDRMGKLLAPSLEDLLKERPANGDATIRNDLPNEDGIPNHRPDPTQPAVDNHHMVTGSDTLGRLYKATATCDDWTSTTYRTGTPRCGFAWPRGMRKAAFGGGGFSSSHWISGFNARGCEAGIHITSSMGGSGNIIGSDGGYGGFYCFALTP